MATLPGQPTDHNDLSHILDKGADGRAHHDGFRLLDVTSSYDALRGEALTSAQTRGVFSFADSSAARTTAGGSRRSACLGVRSTLGAGAANETTLSCALMERIERVDPATTDVPH